MTAAHTHISLGAASGWEFEADINIAEVITTGTNSTAPAQLQSNWICSFWSGWEPLNARFKCKLKRMASARLFQPGSIGLAAVSHAAIHDLKSLEKVLISGQSQEASVINLTTRPRWQQGIIWLLRSVRTFSSGSSKKRRRRRGGLSSEMWKISVEWMENGKDAANCCPVPPSPRCQNSKDWGDTRRTSQGEVWFCNKAK